MTEKPGAEIRRRLERMTPPRSHGWLAMRLGVSRQYVSALIRAEKSIGPQTALRLARELGDDARYWVRLQADYDVAKAEREEAERTGNLIG